jgi:hypothetical protein
MRPPASSARAAKAASRSLQSVPPGQPVVAAAELGNQTAALVGHRGEWDKERHHEAVSNITAIADARDRERADSEPRLRAGAREA